MSTTTLRGPARTARPGLGRITRRGPGRPSRPEAPQRRRGLTLIELLVLLAMGAIVAGLLAPGLSEARVQGVRQAELENLRTLINLAHAYAARDPQNILGPIHPEAANFFGEGYADYGGGPGTSPFLDWGDAFAPPTRAFNRVLYGFEGVDPARPAETAPGDRSVYKPFQCLGQDLGWQQWPGFGGFSDEAENPYFKSNGTSFRMNHLTFSNGSILGIYTRPANRIPAPALTFAFMEARAYQTLSTNDTWGFLTPGELTGYHKKLGFFLVVYADGHTAFADMGDGTFFPHEPDLGGFDVRGTWGRMDCLPDPPLPD